MARERGSPVKGGVRAPLPGHAGAQESGAHRRSRLQAVAGPPPPSLAPPSSSGEVKRNAYRRNGVKEYVVYRVLDRKIDWFVLRNGEYERLARDSAGHYESLVFAGLRLDPEALIRGDLAAVLSTLREGLGSAGHIAFVERLSSSS